MVCYTVIISNIQGDAPGDCLMADTEHTQRLCSWRLVGSQALFTQGPY